MGQSCAQVLTWGKIEHSINLEIVGHGGAHLLSLLKTEAANLCEFNTSPVCTGQPGIRSKTLFKHNNYNKKTAGKGLQAITTAIRKGSRLLQNEEGNRALSATPGFSMIKTLTISHNHLVVL